MSSSDQGRYQPLTYFQLMEVSLRELLVEKGVLTEEAIAEEVAAMRARTPERGARVVAKAWVDAEYKKRLLANGTTACEELGLEIPALKLVVVENTAQVHNVIV
ncbi:MAG TPA: nitrile hydratase subunit alpha, partial [Burkholderiales bacterium]|nr:nitrile hydratase subunit alpha [Burkholderiales bacterium]